jgi:glycosyltransferase involved in cell wall biosynthesis
LLRKSEIRNPKSDIQNRRFDVVFFSTTQFPVMILGPIWKRKFGVPYVVDFQDPWLDDYYERTGTQRPGGKTRHGLSRKLAAKLEPRVMRDVSQVISVSPSYVQSLRTRYPHLPTDSYSVLPFGAPERDFQLLNDVNVTQRLFNRSDGRQRWLYIGRAGDDMAPALRVLFSSIAVLRRSKPADWQNVRLHFVGTSYAPEGRAVKSVEPIAAECGVSDIVEERTSRIPYFETLKALSEADALLVIGSDSPSYSASKLYPYMLAGPPMLSILHEQSPAVEILRKCNAGDIVTFQPGNIDASIESMRDALQRLLHNTNNREPITENARQSNLDATEFAQFTAREMTRRMCAAFDCAVAEGESS